MTERDKITVGLFFGKKDDNLLWYLYQIVTSADFNFIVKATLKYFLKNDKFKIHYFVDLEPIMDEEPTYEAPNQQRNINFFQSDGDLYEWISSLPKHMRPIKIKQIVTERLLECCEIVKNGEPSEEDKNTPPYPLFILSNGMINYPMDLLQMQSNGMNLMNGQLPIIQNNLDNKSLTTQPANIRPQSIKLDEESKKALKGSSSILSYGKMGSD